MDQFLSNLLMEKRSTFKSTYRREDNVSLITAVKSWMSCEMKMHSQYTQRSIHIVTVLFSIFISQWAVYVTGMRKMT